MAFEIIKLTYLLFPLRESKVKAGAKSTRSTSSKCAKTASGQVYLLWKWTTVWRMRLRWA